MAKADDKKRGLGRGLSALLGDRAPLAAVAAVMDASRDAEDAPVVVPPSLSGLKTLPIEQIVAGKFQPRHYFDETALEELTQSVREKGVLQPILVRPLGDGQYEIIAGERRWRAAQRAQRHEIPAIVQDLNDRDALEIALVENLQRQDLSVLEEAEGYRRLMEEFTHTQEELARVVGKSRSHVANIMRLLGLSPAVKAALENGQITAGHARALLSADHPDALMQRIIAENLTVRDVERLVSGEKNPTGTSTKPAGKGKGSSSGADKDADILALERDLSQSLGLKVSISNRDGQGMLTLHYASLEQLDSILSRLSATAV